MSEHPTAGERDAQAVTHAVAVGGTLFLLGLVFIAVDVLPYFLGAHNRPLWLNLACLLAPIGFAVAVWPTVRRGRAEQRRALEELNAG